MLPGLALAALFASQPTPTPEEPKKPKPSPEARLAELDHKRIELHTGLRGYGRFLGGPAAIGGSWQLGLGVRVVRGLYVTGEIGAGAHALPFGVAGQAFVGLRHELRMTKWVRPSVSLGYTHLFDATFDAYGPKLGGKHDRCGCEDDSGWSSGFGFDLDAGAKTELASRSGVQGGFGLRFPFKRAPRLSLYLRGDVAYYFDDRPGRLQGGGSLGLQIVF